MTLAHLAISSARNFEVCSGVPPTGSMPMSLKRFLISVSLTALCASCDSRSMIGRGVPAGARNMTQVEDSSGGPPAFPLGGPPLSPAAPLPPDNAGALILPPPPGGHYLVRTSPHHLVFFA